ncbi:MAG: hypothetical protein ACOX18_05575 [Bacillota bacterium]|jgi:hypothetical protein
MTIIYVAIIAFILILIWRISRPGDLRLTRGYIGRYLQDSQGKGPVRVELDRLPVSLPTAEADERVFYQLRAEFGDGSQQEALVQVFYPLESVQQQRERQAQPGESQQLPTTSTAALQSRYAPNFEKELYQDLTEEQRVVALQRQALDAEIRQLELLNQQDALFPRLLAYDEKRLITFATAVGPQRLDDALQEHDEAGKLALLTPLVEDLARFHDWGRQVMEEFPPGAGHTEEQIKESLRECLQSWVQAGMRLTPDGILEILNALTPLLTTAAAEIGLRLIDSSPRGYFLGEGQVMRPTWGRVVRDVSALDLIELICDPAVRLSAEGEFELMRAYVERRDISAAEKQRLAWDVLRLAVYYRLRLSGFLAIAASEQRDLGLPYWDEATLAHTIRNLRVDLAEDPELATLARLLEPRLERLLSLTASHG